MAATADAEQPETTPQAAEPAPEEAKIAEAEEDAPAEKRPKLGAGAVVFNTEDTTLNVQQALDGELLMALSDGGFQYLLAGARANVGLKAGRYMFEVAIVESRNPTEGSSAGNMQTPRPRQLVRVGFSTSSSSLFVGDSAESICFDSEGIFSATKKRVGQKFGQGSVVAVVLNLDPKSANANTVSLFKDGVRASEPQPLPEALKGKPLFPAVAYRNTTLRVCFGPVLRRLPFVCHSVGDAAKADCEVVQPPAPPKDKKYEVLFPVGLPDEGTFDWVDQFLAKNRNYTELSDRAVVQWATKSGMRPAAGKAGNPMNFGIPLIDDLSVQRILNSVVPTMQRNFLVVDVKDNLMASERTAALARFAACDFKRVAHVFVGEPPADFKKHIQDELLKAKEEKVAKKKRLEVERKKAEELRKKKAQEAKKAREAKSEKKEVKEEGEEKAEKEEKEEEKKEEEDEPMEEAEKEEEKVELTEEEKKQWFRKGGTPDISSKDLSACFTSFTLPTKDEGFTEVKYVWQPEKKAKEVFSQWMLQKKATQRVDGIQPGEWFKEQSAAWSKLIEDWKRKQTAFKDSSKKRQAEQKKKEAAKKRKLEEAKEKAEKAEKAEEGEGGDGEAAKVEAEDADEAKEEEEVQIDAADLDVFSVEDIDDIGNKGEPLYANFMHADWALLALRFELHMLVHAFQKDLSDPERSAFHESHTAFYYSKYFKKQLNVRDYGVDDIAKLVALVSDTMDVDKATSMLESALSDDTPLDNFVKLAEEDRRDRLRRIDMGDESAEVKISRPAPVAAAPAAGGGGKGGGAARSTYGSGPAPNRSGPGQRPPAPSSAMRSGYGAPAPGMGYGGYPGKPMPSRGSPYGAPPPSVGAAYGYGPAAGFGKGGFGAPPPGYGSPYGAPPGAPYGMGGAYGKGVPRW